MTAAGLGGGAWLGIASLPHADPIRSSDVEACSLLSAADAGRLLGPLSKAPQPAKENATVSGYTSGSRYSLGHSYTETQEVKNFDTCVYLPGEGVQFVKTTVVPAAGTSLDLVWDLGDRRAVDGALRYAPLDGVGDRAVIGSGQLGTTGISRSVVFVQRGAWAIEINLLKEPPAVAADLARALAAAPRLQQPPASDG